MYEAVFMWRATALCCRGVAVAGLDGAALDLDRGVSPCRLPVEPAIAGFSPLQSRPDRVPY